MEIYLRQRSGIVCLITIALLLVFSHLYNHSSASRRFRRMCIYALCHVHTDYPLRSFCQFSGYPRRCWCIVLLHLLCWRKTATRYSLAKCCWYINQHHSAAGALAAGGSHS